MESQQEQRPDESDEHADRRTLLSRVVMGCGLAAGYGAFAAVAVRFLYPAKPTLTRWVFVAGATDIGADQSIPFTTPAGERVTVTRRGNAETADGFTALSSVCPHLGCQVHWEGHNNRYFCPCHNGVFDPTGKATAGPPAEAGQSLSSYPLKVERGLLFIEVSAARLAQADSRAGHDDCLGPLDPGRESAG